MVKRHFSIENQPDALLLQLQSEDGLNRLSRECIVALTGALIGLAAEFKPLVITGTRRFFSVGADLQEITQLNAVDAYEFSKLGQGLMQAVEQFPLPVFAAISGHCMGGGLDLALACDSRIAAPSAVFGHRGAALGLLTGWGGTQRLPRLIGKAKALELFVAAEKVEAPIALKIGLVESIVQDPAVEALQRARACFSRLAAGAVGRP